MSVITKTKTVSSGPSQDLAWLGRLASADHDQRTAMSTLRRALESDPTSAVQIRVQVDGRAIVIDGAWLRGLLR